MESTGRLINVTRDILTSKLNITFQIDDEPIDELNDLAAIEKLRIEAKKYSKKRSLDANSYAWVLFTKIANHPDIKTSKEEVYEEMLQKYGYLDQDEEGYIVITLKNSIDIRRVGGHWKFIKGNGQFNSYVAIKGSSNYSTSEMAHFLDQVVQEAKDLGIQTETPDEIARMKALWGTSNG